MKKIQDMSIYTIERHWWADCFRCRQTATLGPSGFQLSVNLQDPVYDKIGTGKSEVRLSGSSR
jgi:hypothetical protein